MNFKTKRASGKILLENIQRLAAEALIQYVKLDSSREISSSLFLQPLMLQLHN